VGRRPASSRRGHRRWRAGIGLRTRDAADFYGRRDPSPVRLYRAIRNRAAAVWLDAHGVWALGRFEDVRAALRADAVLISSRGVALNDAVNQLAGETTLASDGNAHRLRRGLVMKPMMPSALRDVQVQVQALADELVDGLIARDGFDGRRLATSVEIVSNLVGQFDGAANGCSHGRPRPSTVAMNARARAPPRRSRSARWRSTPRS
jgi:cytochrome P450